MMVYLLLRQTVEDYGRWKEGFDKHLAARQAAGATKEVYVMRNVENAQEISVLVGWHDVVQARAFAGSVSLQTALNQMGVVGLPQIVVLKKVVPENGGFYENFT